MLLNHLKYLFVGAGVLAAYIALFVGGVYFIHWLLESKSETPRNIAIVIVFIVLSYLVGLFAYNF